MRFYNRVEMGMVTSRVIELLDATGISSLSLTIDCLWLRLRLWLFSGVVLSDRSTFGCCGSLFVVGRFRRRLTLVIVAEDDDDAMGT